MEARMILRELDETLREVEVLLKHPEAGSALAERGVNTSLALVALDALRAYVEGRKMLAAEDFATVAEEIFARAALTGKPD